MPIVLNGSTGITANNLGVETIVDTAGTAGPSLPNNIVEMNFVDVLNDVTSLQTNKLDKDQNIVLGTSVAASGTAVDFVGIPEGVKRITVMFDGVSTNGSSNILVQIGAGSVDTTGYLSEGMSLVVGGAFAASSTSGMIIRTDTASQFADGVMALNRLSDNLWIANSIVRKVSQVINLGVGDKTLSGPLDRVRITTVSGTDQFDNGTINISWEF